MPDEVDTIELLATAGFSLNDMDNQPTPANHHLQQASIACTIFNLSHEVTHYEPISLLH